MTTAKYPRPQSGYALPDPPDREPDDMTSFDHLAANGNAHHLAHHLGRPETTIVSGEHYLSPDFTRDLTGVRYPDLLIAFNVNPAAYRRSNAYIISEQGKPPDFVLEIASRRTGRADAVDKRKDYAALGIPEYWRFDETGQHHRTRLAGDRLVNGQYQPITLEQLPGGVIQGYSPILNLYIRWHQGRLEWHDPATGRHILTYDDQREAARLQREVLGIEREARGLEREARIAAEARVRELEEQLRRQNN